MCGRYVAASDPDGLVRFFVVDERRGGELPPRWNVAPSQQVPAVVAHDGRRLLVDLRWGLVPSWADDPRVGVRMINARAETAASKPAFAQALQQRRCLLPADGFYEWRVAADGTRLPHLLSAPSGEPLAFAGLWSPWGSGATALRSCTILTTRANADVVGLHDRMPVLLPRAAWSRWLDPSAPASAVADLLAPAPAGSLRLTRVGQAVNDVRNDGPHLVEPTDEEPGQLRLL